MKFTAHIVLFALLACPALAVEHDMFYGIWGTQKQCERTPIKPGGTVLSAPFEINKNWLKQGQGQEQSQQWCILKWGPIEARAGSFFTNANAQCGEDSVQDYLLGMTLKGDELTLQWSVLQANGPLKRCTR